MNEGIGFRDYTSGCTTVRIYDNNLVCIIACRDSGAHRTDTALSVEAGASGESLDSRA